MRVDKSWIAFANLSMQQKLLIVFLFLVSLPIILVSYASYYSYSRSIQTNTEAYAAEITSKMMTKLDDYVTDLYNMSAMPLYNEVFLQWLSQPGVELDKQRSLDLYVANLNKIKPDTVSVYVFDRYGNVFYNIKSGGKRSNFDEVKSVWEKIAAEGDGRPELVSTQEVASDRSPTTYYAFSVIRELKGTWDMEPVGYIVFDTNISAISRQIESADDVTKGKTLLVDENNVVVFDSERKLITHNISSDESIRRAVDDKGSFQILKDGEPYICTYVISNLTHWKMLVYIPLEEVTRQASVTRNFTLTITAAFIAFALFIAIAISFALTRPLRKIKLLMQEVQRGNLDVSFNLKYSDEVGMLGRHFNMMVSRVQTLIEEVEFTQARKKEAELIALQSQINPHFIYNTLEMIRMTAEVNDDDEVSEMTYILGKLLRYGVNHANRSVTIREEIDHLQNYLALQNMRFADRYKLIIHIPEDIYALPCIKLIFQPIIENAIHHAFRDKPESGTIQIAAAHDGEDIVIHLSDDGVGMNEQALKILRDHISGVQLIDSGRGIGLRNINERIKLQFGERYGLKVDSREEIGTIVTLRLPGSSSKDLN
ncbi:sensor histidine kinase [Paenibacillus sepulcri]